LIFSQFSGVVGDEDDGGDV